MHGTYVPCSIPRPRQIFERPTVMHHMHLCVSMAPAIGTGFSSAVLFVCALIKYNLNNELITHTLIVCVISLFLYYERIPLGISLKLKRQPL